MQSRKKKYTCPFPGCTFSFNRPYRLAQHRLRHVDVSRKKKYTCPFPGCTFSFNRPYRLAQHRLRHVDVRPFACKEENCSKAYTSKSHLDRHINSVHKETELDVLYCCPKCIKNYSNRQNLNRHMKKHHGEDKESYICDYCSALFIKKHHMKAHMFKHTGVKAFKCLYCNKEYASLADKKKHIRNHKVYSCDQCYSKFYRWTDMLAHTKNDHVSPEFICNDCGKEFKERPLFLRHVKRHMPAAAVNIFLCPYENCQRCYTRSNNLKQHIMVKHQGKRFGCELCGAQLSTKAKLNEHIDRHSRPKVILRVAKTIENGRKRRKDMNTVRVSSAKKLAGLNIVQQEFEHTEQNNDFSDNNNLYQDQDYEQI